MPLVGRRLCAPSGAHHTSIGAGQKCSPLRHRSQRHVRYARSASGCRVPRSGDVGQRLQRRPKTNRSLSMVVHWCTQPSPATSFSAREKAFLRVFFCRSGTVRTACSRSLCTCNFAKSVHFSPRLAVYHPYFDCLDHMFTVYLPFFCMFTALERGNCPRPPRSGEKNGGHTGP